MRHAAIALTCFALLACSPPSDPAGWAKQAYKRNRVDEKLKALEMVRKAPGDKKGATPFLVKILEEKQHPRARAAAALALGEGGDPAAIEPLMKAIDTGAKDRDAIDMDRRIAEALGALKAEEAVGLLGKLTTFPDGFVQVAAVDALGAIGVKAAVDTLTVVALDPQGEPFTSKKATLALGRIGDEKSMPVILKMMFVSRGGVSFFPEAAFAASQIGPTMIRRSSRCWRGGTQSLPPGLGSRSIRRGRSTPRPRACSATSATRRWCRRSSRSSPTPTRTRGCSSSSGSTLRRRSAGCARGRPSRRSPTSSPVSGTQTCATGSATRSPGSATRGPSRRFAAP
jgi:hypothetical protein